MIDRWHRFRVLFFNLVDVCTYWLTIMHMSTITMSLEAIWHLMMGNSRKSLRVYRRYKVVLWLELISIATYIFITTHHACWPTFEILPTPMPEPVNFQIALAATKRYHQSMWLVSILELYYNLSLSILEIICSKHPMGCYCHLDYIICYLVWFIMHADLS